MVTDEQVRRLRKLSNTEKDQEVAARGRGWTRPRRGGICGWNGCPARFKKDRSWRTRGDPFNEVWDAVQKQMEESPGLEARTLFEWLQREHPGQFSDGANPHSPTADQIMAGDRKGRRGKCTSGQVQPGGAAVRRRTSRTLTELGITLAGQTASNTWS